MSKTHGRQCNLTAGASALSNSGGFCLKMVRIQIKYKNITNFMQKTHSYEFSIPIPTSYFRFYYCGTQCPCCQDDAWIPSVVLHSCTKSASSGRRNCDESWVSLITTPSSRSQPRPAWRSFTHSTQSMLLQTNTWHTLTVTWPRKQQKSEKASVTFLNKIQSKYQDERQRETSLINGSLSRTTGQPVPER